MILWFLRLFAQFTELESLSVMNANTIESLDHELQTVRAEYQKLETENLRLQDRLDAATEDRKQLWALVTQSLNNERQALMMTGNEHWQKQYGVTPFPEAPAIPANQEHHAENSGSVGRAGRMLPSELVASRTADYWAGKTQRAKV